MQKRLTLLAVVVVASLIAAVAAWAGNPHFLRFDDPTLVYGGASAATAKTMFLDENGLISDERTYLAGTVLLWNRGDRLLRLEGDLTRDEALKLAESVG